MKNLLFKELRLCVPAQAWIYFALVACVLIPGWPPIVGLFYVTVSVMIIFSSSPRRFSPSLCCSSAIS